ncbi:MAG: GTP 3',8-cyclase MoaA [Deltaproteobacteria bacterium]|nr:GTP 3',8-cyclase MoaA [Deltaproteobacteria bacterium]
MRRSVTWFARTNASALRARALTVSSATRGGAYHSALGDSTTGLLGLDAVAPVLDRWARPLKSLRISVTDRCNQRCAYCMPEPDYLWLPRENLLTFEELTRVARIFGDLGVEKIRLTGGEPLLRHRLPVLVAALAADRRLRDLALTTNGLLLGSLAGPLRRAGLMRVTVSLDTLQADRFLRLTRRNQLSQVIEGIEAARRAGFGPLKLDTVALRGTNDDEIPALLTYARSIGAEIRFIEYMDVGGATHWKASDVVSRREILAAIEARFGAIEALAAEEAAPAERFRLADGTTFGIIASVTAPFCRTCDRARLTADGHLFTCLYASRGLSLLEPLRAGLTDDELRALIAGVWRDRSDRSAEEREALADRAPAVQIGALRRDPHLEMHTRGG